jgi:hypothetical protein
VPVKDLVQLFLYFQKDKRMAIEWEVPSPAREQSSVLGQLGSEACQACDRCHDANSVDVPGIRMHRPCLGFALPRNRTMAQPLAQR